jgi:hypothetical protein
VVSTTAARSNALLTTQPTSNARSNPSSNRPPAEVTPAGRRNASSKTTGTAAIQSVVKPSVTSIQRGPLPASAPSGTPTSKATSSTAAKAKTSLPKPTSNGGGWGNSAPARPSPSHSAKIH